MPMGLRQLVAFLSVSLIPLSCAAQQARPYAILPASEAASVSRMCSRAGPANVEGGWQPTQADIDSLEAHLPQISNLTAAYGSESKVEHPATFQRQYVGVVIGGRRLIYVNAFPPDDDTNWRTRLVNVCDGGPSFWGVVFDPSTVKFSDLSMSGTLPPP